MGNKTTRSVMALSLWGIVSGLLLCTTPAYAAEEKGKEPTVITSQTLWADNKEKTALFEGSVVAKKGETTLSSDKMLVHYSEDKGNNIKRIDAEGHVKLIKGDRTVTSQTATYLIDPERVIFTGDPVATDGDNVVKGTKMTYFIKDDRYTVENSKVFLKEKKSQKQ